MTAITVDTAAIDAILADPKKVEALLGELEAVNFQGLLAAFQAGDADTILASMENLTGFVATFVPTLQPAVYVFAFLLFANKAREAGYWHPVGPDDLMYQRELENPRSGR
jgi:ABC-type amino acid transport substrate-binding protein